MQIYASYDEEPEDIYHPLTEELYQQFYDLELAHFSGDLQFYTSQLPSGAEILELGCGSGRLTRLLSQEGYRVTGIDRSISMLRACRERTAGTATLCCMDMRQLCLKKRFAAVIIPYNTLNLLLSATEVRGCLSSCRALLNEDSILLTQLHIPEFGPTMEDNRSFSFQLFDLPGGGKLVKEIIKVADPEKQLIEMTERYKVRPMRDGAANINYSHTMLLNGWSREQWLNQFAACGFTCHEHRNPRISHTASPEAETTFFLTASCR